MRGLLDMLDPPVNESGHHRGGARVALECLARHSRHTSSDINAATVAGPCIRVGFAAAALVFGLGTGAQGSAKKIAQPMRVDNCSRKVWNLAKKSIEDRSKKISHSMRAENCSRKVLKVDVDLQSCSRKIFAPLRD